MKGFRSMLNKLSSKVGRGIANIFTRNRSTQHHSRIPRLLRRRLRKYHHYEVVEVEEFPHHFFQQATEGQEGISTAVCSEFPFYGTDNISDFFQESLYRSTRSESSTLPPSPGLLTTITGLQQNPADSQISLHQIENIMYTDTFHNSPEQSSRPRSISQGSGCSKYSGHSQSSNPSLLSLNDSEPNLADSQTNLAQSESGYSEYPASSGYPQYHASSGYATSHSIVSYSRFHSSEYPASSGYCDSRSCSSGYCGSACLRNLPSNEPTLDSLQNKKRVQEWVDSLPKYERKRLDNVVDMLLEGSLQGQCSINLSHYRNESQWSCKTHCSTLSAAETVYSDPLVQHPSPAPFPINSDAISHLPHYFRPDFERQNEIPNNFLTELPFYGDNHMSDFFQDHLYISMESVYSDPLVQHPTPAPFSVNSDVTSHLSHSFRPDFERQNEIPNNFLMELPFYGDNHMSDFFQDHLYISMGSVSSTYQCTNLSLQNISPNVTTTVSKSSSQSGNEVHSHLSHITTQQPTRPRSSSQSSEHSLYSNYSQDSNCSNQSQGSDQSHRSNQSQGSNQSHRSNQSQGNDQSHWSNQSYHSDNIHHSKQNCQSHHVDQSHCSDHSDCSTCSCHNLSTAGAADPDPLVQLPSSPPFAINPDATNQQRFSPTPYPSHSPLQKRASIRDEILLTVVNCLMHRRNCQIPNCPCRSLQDRFGELFHQNPSYVPHKHAAETCKTECGPDANPREPKTSPKKLTPTIISRANHTFAMLQNHHFNVSAPKNVT